LIKYLTFDCYGTLIDWREGIETNFRECFLGRLGVPPTKTRGSIFARYVSLEAQEESGTTGYKSYKDVLEQTSTQLAKSLGLAFSGEPGKRFADSITRWHAFPDTAPTLNKLGQLGYKRTILSNIDRDLLQKTIRSNNLEVDDFITAQDVRSYKPSKGHWLEFFRRTGAKKEELLHVANSVYHDIIPAKEIGISTVWVNRYEDEPPTRVKPDFIVPDISELIEVLQRA
jgi:2-haloacid dehalogenase